MPQKVNWDRDQNSNNIFARTSNKYFLLLRSRGQSDRLLSVSTSEMGSTEFLFYSCAVSANPRNVGTVKDFSVTSTRLFLFYIAAVFDRLQECRNRQRFLNDINGTDAMMLCISNFVAPSFDSLLAACVADTPKK